MAEGPELELYQQGGMARKVILYVRSRLGTWNGMP